VPSIVTTEVATYLAKWPNMRGHGFGIAMIEAGVPITLVRDLLGHADLKTTEIYLSAVGQEKRNIVLKAWD